MNIEEILNEWYELVKKDAEKEGKTDVQYSDCIKLTGCSLSEPLEKQAENGEYSITLTLNYWNEDEIQKLKKYVNNYGKRTDK